MKVFLSWSGERSKALAEYLHKWLPLVIQSVKPWFSPDDIEKGDRWLANLSGELEAHSVAIVCLTLENRTAPWLLFEAGALSKALNKAYVCPLLLGLEPADVQGPLAQFQLTPATKDEVRRLLGTINGRLEAPINDGQLDEAYKVFWPRLEKRLSEIATQGTPSPSAKRPKDDILAEILERVRGLDRRLGLGGEIGEYGGLALARRFANNDPVTRQELYSAIQNTSLPRILPSSPPSRAEHSLAQIDMILLTGPQFDPEVVERLTEYREHLKTIIAQYGAIRAKVDAGTPDSSSPA